MKDKGNQVDFFRWKDNGHQFFRWDKKSLSRGNGKVNIIY